MAIDFSEYFKRYEAVVAEIDAVFAKFEAEMGDLVKCGKGCSDCCHALFDITLVEAIYIHHKFNERFSGLERSTIMTRADTADRQIHKLKRKVYKASQEGRPASEILMEVSKARVRCPMLSDENLCALYEFRPITCRLYGVPTSIADEAHTCNLSGFKGGEKYPTVNMDIVLDRLITIGRDMQKGIGSRFKEMGDMLVPLSMALVTDYDEEYLGVNKEDADKEPAAAKASGPVSAKGAGPAELKAPGAADACSSCTESKSACESCTSKTVVLGGHGTEQSMTDSINPDEFTPEQLAERKLYMYEKMSPRRRKFVDRMGFENWDPFAAPFDPIDIRRDRTGFTSDQLTHLFMRHCGKNANQEYTDAVNEFNVMLVMNFEKVRPVFEYCLWYAEHLKKHGVKP